MFYMAASDGWLSGFAEDLMLLFVALAAGLVPRWLRAAMSNRDQERRIRSDLRVLRERLTEAKRAADALEVKRLIRVRALVRLQRLKTDLLVVAAVLPLLSAGGYLLHSVSPLAGPRTLLMAVVSLAVYCLPLSRLRGIQRG